MNDILKNAPNIEHESIALGTLVSMLETETKRNFLDKADIKNFFKIIDENYSLYCKSKRWHDGIARIRN